MTPSPLPADAAGRFRIGGDLFVNRLGFGAMRITGAGVWGPPEDRDAALAVLRRAVELGVDLIDTAESYGPHVSEELIAEALYPYPEGLVIATKGGLKRTGPGRWPVCGRPAFLRECLEGSLQRLRLGRIDLWQLHRIDPDVPMADQFGTIKAFQDEGKVRHLGLSNVTVAQLDAAVAAGVRVATVQNRYNLADRESEPVLAACEERGIGFIPWFPVATGALADADGPLAAIAAEHGATPAQLALAWLLHRSPAMLPIPGTSRVAHLEENVAAAGIRLTDEQMARLEAASEAAG